MSYQNKAPKGKVVYFLSEDSQGGKFEKYGDFGLIAVGNSIPGKKDTLANVEVDFTAKEPQQIAIAIATLLLTAHNTDKNIALEALNLFNQAKEEGRA